MMLIGSHAILFLHAAGSELLTQRTPTCHRTSLNKHHGAGINFMAQEPPDPPWSIITTSSSSPSTTPPTSPPSVPKKAATPSIPKRPTRPTPWPAGAAVGELVLPTQGRIPTRPVWISEEGAERPELRAVVGADRHRRVEGDTQRQVAMCLAKAQAKLTPFRPSWTLTARTVLTIPERDDPHGHAPQPNMRYPWPHLVVTDRPQEQTAASSSGLRTPLEQLLQPPLASGHPIAPQPRYFASATRVPSLLQSPPSLVPATRESASEQLPRGPPRKSICFQGKSERPVAKVLGLTTWGAPPREERSRAPRDQGRACQKHLSVLGWSSGGARRLPMSIPKSCGVLRRTHWMVDALVSKHGTWDFDYAEILGVSPGDTSSHWMNFIHFHTFALDRSGLRATQGKQHRAERPRRRASASRSANVPHSLRPRQRPVPPARPEAQPSTNTLGNSSGHLGQHTSTYVVPTLLGNSIPLFLRSLVG